VQYLIAIAGGLICLAGLVILIAPEKFKSMMNTWTGQPRFLFAIIVRVVIGAILLAEATNLRFPLAMKIIGGVSIAAAIGLLLIGQDRLDRFIAFWMRKPDNLFRVSSVFAIAFGAFLVYVTT
jgi:uncharacterized protein YjeT (DUF2065 family)